MRKPNIAGLIFIVCGLLLFGGLAFAVGLYSGVERNAVFEIVDDVHTDIMLVYEEITDPGKKSFWFSDVAAGQPAIASPLPDRLAEGLILLAGVTGDHRNVVRVIDRDGTVIHEWYPDWFEIWGDEGDFPEDRRPTDQPGKALHGLELLQSGDLVLNYSELSTMRLDPCGNVVWKLENLGHHSVHVAEDGMIWVAAENYYEEGPTGLQNHMAPLRSYTLQKISSDGEILETAEVIDILMKNDLYGLLFLSNLENNRVSVSGDTMHLNDVETFPSTFESEIFETGDIMLSLRNINTILVIDGETHDVKFRATGEFLRQHDPDFIGGDKITLFDNRNLLPSRGPEPVASRIIELDARTGEASVIIDGSEDPKFFTPIMGKHQHLPNGNFLIISAQQGRILEMLPDGSLAWEYHNRVGEQQNGLISEAILLPPHMDKAYFESLGASCNGNGR